MSPFDRPDWLAFCRSIAESPNDELPKRIASDWLQDQGLTPAQAVEATVGMPIWSDLLPAGYYGIGRGIGSGIGRGIGIGSGRGIGSGIGRGIGSGSGRGIGSGIGREYKELIVEAGKNYLILTVDWYAWCGRCLRQVSAFEYAFELVSKFDTNRGDVFGQIAAGDKELRRAATYQHFQGEALIGHARVGVFEWKGLLPQEKGYPG